MSRKIYVVGGDTNYASWMQGEVINPWGGPEDADLVVFTGGVDVNPALYDEPRHPLTQASNYKRDMLEVEMFSMSLDAGKRMIGICRGAQFLCVMAGGKLVQHQENKGSHPQWVCRPYTDPYSHKQIEVSSDHHQAQFPWYLPDKEFRILGYTNDLLSFHYDGNQKEMIIGKAVTGANRMEVEDVYYPKINALAIQSHPEWMDENSPAVTHYRKLLNLHMENKL